MITFPFTIYKPPFNDTFIFHSQRRAICVGFRVKVRFIKKSNNTHGRSYRKIKWYGGVICGTANGRRIVKIHYDDGTSEVANFPDKDIIVDDVNNGRHGGNGSDGGSNGGAFVPMPSLQNNTLSVSSSVEEEGGVEEEANEEEQSGNFLERMRQERRSDINKGEETQMKSERMDEAEEEKSDKGGKMVLSSDVPTLATKSSISEECSSIIGRTTITNEGITGGIKMSSSVEVEKVEAEEEDGEIVESCPLAPSSGKEEKQPWSHNEDLSSMSKSSEYHQSTIVERDLPKEEQNVHEMKSVGGCLKDSNGATLLKSNDKPQNEAPSKDSGNKAYEDEIMKSSNDKKTQQQQIHQSKANEISSTVIEINTVDDLRVVESEVGKNDATEKDSGFSGGVDSTPPTVVSVTQTAVADHSEQNLLEKKKKKRGPLSIHIGLPGAKRKKLMNEGMKLKPQDETSIATANNDANSMDEIGAKRGNVGDDGAVKVDKSPPTISAHLEVESHSSGAQIDSASFVTTHVTGHESCGDSLSDGEIQEGSETRETYSSIMEVEPKSVSHYWIS